MRKDKIVGSLLTLLIFFAVAGVVQAQNPSFIIGGWVFDHEGNPVSGVTIEITHLETGNSIPGIEPTDDLGRWIDNLGNLPLGDVPAEGSMIQIVATAPDGRTNTTVVPRAAEDPQIVNITLPPLAAPPTVTVRYPNGGESIERGTPVNVSAHATDDVEVTSVVFYYSSDGGTTWKSIGSGTLVDGNATDGIWNATWDTTLLTPGSNYLIKAVATDNDGLTASDRSNATFTILPAAGEYQVSIVITEPWDQVPIHVNDPAITDALSLVIKINETAPNRCKEVVKWDASQQKFVSYVPGVPLNNFAINGKEETPFAHVTATTEVTFTGTPWWS